MTEIKELYAMREKMHREIKWEEIDSHWDDETWVGWELLWLFNAQCQELTPGFTPLKIKTLWGPLRRSFRQERLYLKHHPKLRWVREPAAYLEKKPYEKPAPDFEFVNKNGEVCFTVELKRAFNREDAEDKREQLDHVYYEKGMKHPYASHGADVVVFTNLEDGKHRWREWYCYREEDGSYPRIDQYKLYENNSYENF